MLDIQRDKDREKARLMTEEGLTADEADRILDADIRPFRPRYAESETKRIAKNKGLFDRVQEFHQQRGEIV